MDRRSLLEGLGGAVAGAALTNFMSPFGARAQGVTTLPFANGERPLVRYPGKRPLIQLTARPPQLETPFSVFDEGVITPNDAFFVRYHLSRHSALDRSRSLSSGSEGQGGPPAFAIIGRS